MIINNKSIESNELVTKLLKGGGVLAGGAIRDFALGQSPKDFDIFFLNILDLDETRRIIGLRPVMATHYTETYIIEGKLIQLIFKKFYESPEKIINDFDFNAIRGYMTKDGYFISEEMIIDLENKALSINLITKPIKSLERLVKYVRQDYDVKEAYDYIVSLLATKSHLVMLNGSYYED